MFIVRKRRSHRTAEERKHFAGKSDPRGEVEDGGIHRRGLRENQMEKPYPISGRVEGKAEGAPDVAIALKLVAIAMAVFVLPSTSKLPPFSSSEPDEPCD